MNKLKLYGLKYNYNKKYLDMSKNKGPVSKTNPEFYDVM